ncbi:MAG: hypothetical protein CAF43_005320 [Nitrospira sp. CG24C]|nr:MAG: hypothetical protein CAF43_005320 [Nitrospira sp. CG24C]
MKKKQIAKVDPEIVAISEVHAALKDLEPDAQSRVLTYVAGKLKIAPATFETQQDLVERQREVELDSRTNEIASGGREQEGEGLEGISPVAKKWMARNGLKSKQLSTVFSLGVDEIDLVAKEVPGKKLKERMHSVFLLKGIAAYLGTGVARFTHEQMKEACLHYKAFDSTNFSLYFKSFSSEVSGSKDAGYTLTARGIANATEMVKTIC